MQLQAIDWHHVFYAINLCHSISCALYSITIFFFIFISTYREMLSLVRHAFSMFVCVCVSVLIRPISVRQYSSTGWRLFVFSCCCGSNRINISLFLVLIQSKRSNKLLDNKLLLRFACSLKKKKLILSVSFGILRQTFVCLLLKSNTHPNQFWWLHHSVYYITHSPIESHNSSQWRAKSVFFFARFFFVSKP